MSIPRRTCVLCGSDISHRDIRDQVCELCEKDRETMKRKRPKNICPMCGKRMELCEDYRISFCGGGKYYECYNCENIHIYNAETGEEL